MTKNLPEIMNVILGTNCNKIYTTSIVVPGCSSSLYPIGILILIVHKWMF